MTPSVRSSLLFTMTTTAALALSACGNHSSEAGKNAPANSASTATASTAPAPAHTAAAAPAAPASAPAPAASAAAAAPEPLKLVGLTIGTSLNSAHKVAKPSEHFRPDDKVIYASISSSGKSEGGSLNAKWSYFGGSKPIVISNVSQTIPADTASITTFSLHNPNLWPEGRYEIVIELNGKPAAHESFEIRK